MTIEHWYGVEIDRHTWSHPWSATPADAIVSWLMGVRPLEPAYRRVSVHPQPPSGNALPRAALVLPTARGEIAVSFTMEAGRFGINVSLPGNTRAEACGRSRRVFEARRPFLFTTQLGEVESSRAEPAGGSSGRRRCRYLRSYEHVRRGRRRSSTTRRAGVLPRARQRERLLTSKR